MAVTRMKLRKIALTGLFLLAACGSKQVEEPNKTTEVVNLDTQEKEETQAEVDFGQLEAFLYEKIEGEQVARNYGEDSGWTNIIFGADGTFKGSYMGKTAVDDFDGGLNERAQIYYHAEEIHNANFKGVFKITSQVNDYVYEMDLKDFEITTEYGPHDDIYFNVDFALGMNPDGEYYLYIPGTPTGYLPNAGTRLDSNYKKEDFDEDKTQGFIIWNKTDDEVFNQLNLDQ